MSGLVIGVSLMILPIQNVMGMPYPNADIRDLTSKVSIKGVGEVIGDSENKHTLYVKPGNLKFKGKFYQTNGGADCQDLFKLRQITYKMPTKEEFPGIISRGQFYSPAFEAITGVAARNINLGRKIIEAKFKVHSYVEDHKEEYGNYSATKAALELAKEDVEAVKDEMAELSAKLTTDLALAANDPDQMNKIRSDFRRDILKLNYRKEVVLRVKRQAGYSYREALRDWSPYKDQLEWLTNVEANLSQSFSALQRIADESLQDSIALMSSLDSVVIGYASTGYSLTPDKEIETLSERIKDAGLNYHVQSIAPFNIRLNPGVTKSISRVKDNGSALNYELITYNFPLETRVTLGTKKRFVDLPMTIEGDNNKPEVLRYLVSDLEGGFGGSQAYDFPITQGAICGYAKSKQKTYEYTDRDGNHFSRTASETVYESPAPNQPVFVQNVALRYNYYQKAEPISGSCQMDISKTSSFVRNSGRKTSWSWFKRSTHSWDNTRKNLSKNMGLSCSLTKRPQGANPEESKLLNSAFQKALYQDMFTMFLISYAKDYNVKPIKPELLSSDSQFFSKLGEGVMSLCGANLYCQIGGVVLKSLDELVGTRHTGTTSNTTTISGTLKRNLNLDSYLISEGHTNIELRVCLDHTLCEE